MRGMKLRVRGWGKQRHTEHAEHDERTGIFVRSINYVIKRVFVCSTGSERTERTVRCSFIAHPASASSDCNTFVKSQIQTNFYGNTSCPFGNICSLENMSLLLDTGYLDTHSDFGLNAPTNQRLQYRKLIRCSPLKTRGFSSTQNIAGNRTYTRYHYGRQQNKNYTSDYTSDNMWYDGATPGTSAMPDYDIGYETHPYSSAITRINNVA